MAAAMRRVALIYDATRAYDLKVMTGVAEWLRNGANWSLYVEETSLKDQRLPELRSWKGDGVIADFDDPRVAAAVVQARLPAVGFGSGYGWYAPESRIPYFFSNNQAVARLGAEHLLDRGLRNFAFCGYPRTPINGWSEERERAFASLLRERGIVCRAYRGRYRSGARWAAIQGALADWLEGLPKPVGVMAANDHRARQVLEACRSRGLRVPDEVAVVGVDNDELLCRLSTPLLSSVEQGAVRLGHEAAALLDAIMRGARPRQRRIVINPVGVVTRRSTDMLAVGDEIAARALDFIRANACRGIKVGDVVKAVMVSRSGLEVHFREALDHSVHTAIRKARAEQVARLLCETSLSLKHIAGCTGFKSVQHMTAVFARIYGRPPGEHRRTARAGGATIATEVTGE
jgi:LacI family transcriptional regulator